MNVSVAAAAPRTRTPGAEPADRPPAVVIGLGNPYRRDDGVGPAVAAEVDGLGLPGVRVEIVDGDATALLEVWTGVPLAVVVDAVRRIPADPGRVHRFAVRVTAGRPFTTVGHTGRQWPRGAAVASSHGFGLTEALRLGGALDCLPGRLVVFAVEATDVGPGVGLTAPVAAAAATTVAAVHAELGR